MQAICLERTCGRLGVRTQMHRPVATRRALSHSSQNTSNLNASHASTLGAAAMGAGLSLGAFAWCGVALSKWRDTGGDDKLSDEIACSCINSASNTGEPTAKGIVPVHTSRLMGHWVCACAAGADGAAALTWPPHAWPNATCCVPQGCRACTPACRARPAPYCPLRSKTATKPNGFSPQRGCWRQSCDAPTPCVHSITPSLVASSTYCAA